MNLFVFVKWKKIGIKIFDDYLKRIMILRCIVFFLGGCFNFEEFYDLYENY